MSDYSCKCCGEDFSADDCKNSTYGPYRRTAEEMARYNTVSAAMENVFDSFDLAFIRGQLTRNDLQELIAHIFGKYPEAKP